MLLVSGQWNTDKTNISVKEQDKEAEKQKSLYNIHIRETDAFPVKCMINGNRDIDLKKEVKLREMSDHAQYCSGTQEISERERERN